VARSTRVGSGVSSTRPALTLFKNIYFTPFQRLNMIKKLNDSLKDKLFVKEEEVTKITDPKTQIDRDLHDLKFDIAFEIKFEIADELIRAMDALGFRPFFTKRPIRTLGEVGIPTNYCLKCMIIHLNLRSGASVKPNLDTFATYLQLISLVNDYPSKKKGEASYFQCQHCETEWEENPG